MLINHYLLEGKSPYDTKEKFDKYYVESAPLIRTFNVSIRDAERSGRPVEATTPEIINKVHDTVMNNRRVKLHQIGSVVDI